MNHITRMIMQLLKTDNVEYALQVQKHLDTYSGLDYSECSTNALVKGIRASAAELEKEGICP